MASTEHRLVPSRWVAGGRADPTAKQWSGALPKENDLEGHQDQGGKHGGQAGLPKSPRPPKTTERDEDVIRKGSQQGFKDR